MSAVDRFYAIYVTTLMLGFATTEPLLPPSALVPLILILACAFGIQNVLFGRRYMGVDRLLQSDLTPKKGFFFRGYMIDPQHDEREESHFRGYVQSFKTTVAIRIAYGSLIFGFVWLHHKTTGFPFTVATFFHFLALLFIVPMATPSHFLVPLMLNAVAVVDALFRDSPPHPVLIVLYVFSLFTALSLHHVQTLRWSHVQPDLMTKPTAKVRQIITAATAFLIIVAVVNWVTPRQDPFEDPAFQLANKMNRDLARIITDDGKRFTASKDNHGPPNPGAGASPEKSASPPEPGTPPGAGQGPNGGGTSAQKNPNRQKIEDLQQEREKVLKEMAEGNPLDRKAKSEELAEIEKKRGELQADVNSSDADLQSKIERLKKEAETSPDHSQRYEAGKKLQQASQEKAFRDQARAQAPNGAAGAQTPGTGTNPGQAGGPGAGGPGGKAGAGTGAAPGTGALAGAGATPMPGSSGGAAAVGAATAPKPPQEKPNELISEDRLKKLFQIFKFVALAAAALLVALFFWKLTKESQTDDEIEKARRAELEKNEVRRELARLKEVQLSARDEVLKKYLLFLRLMAANEHGKEDFIPPTKFKSDVAEEFPNLSNDFGTINDTFCAALYGGHDVSPDRLKMFNASINAVFLNFR